MERTSRLLSSQILTAAKRDISKEKDTTKFGNVAHFLASAYANALAQANAKSINNNVNSKDMKSFIRNFFKGDVLAFEGSQKNLENFCNGNDGVFFSILRQELKVGLKTDNIYQDLKNRIWVIH